MRKRKNTINSTQPVRTCIVCRKSMVKKELQRYVWNFDTGKTILDSRKNMMGRGAYCCRNEICERAFLTRSQGLKRAFRLK